MTEETLEVLLRACNSPMLLEILTAINTETRKHIDNPQILELNAIALQIIGIISGRY